MANENHADFTPTIPDSQVTPTKAPYVPVGSFKFWAQKVLPNVYDDSLSYYEVLTKLVWHINKMIEDMDNFNQTIDSTLEAYGDTQDYVNSIKDTMIATYNQLQDYVNHYFDNLDVQNEINNKLDVMARNGTLTTLISPFIPDLVSAWMRDNITPTTPVIDESLTISGAAADAKVTGDKIRYLNNAFELTNNKNYANPSDPNYLAGAYLDTSGVEHATNLYNVTGYIPVNGGDVILSSVNSNGERVKSLMRFMTAYDENKYVLSNKGINNEQYSYIVPDGVSFVRISASSSYWSDALQIEISPAITPYVAPNTLLNPRYIPNGFVESNMLAELTVSDGYNIVPTAIYEGDGGFYVTQNEIVYQNTGGFATFGFYILPVDGDSLYTFSGRARFVITVDNSGAVVSYSGNTPTMAYYAEINAVKMYVTYDKSTYPNGFAVCKGDTAKSETKYYLKWLAIPPQALNGLIVTDGYNITAIGERGNGGWYVSGDSLVYSDTGGFTNFGYYICPVDGGSKYSFSGIGRFVITADANGNIVDDSGNTGIRSFNVSENAVKMYFTYDRTLFPNGISICKGDYVRDETKYNLNWLTPSFPEKSINGNAIDNRIYCSIPDTIYMNTSENIKIYLDDILAQKGSYFWCNSVSGLTTYIDEEYMQITCTTAGSYSLNWAVYDSNLQKIDEGTSTVKVSDLTSLASKKALVLGDSFVAYGGLSEALLNVFSEQDKTLTLIGTRGTAPNLHEGRGGWSADIYCNYASAGAFTNPFYHNGTFDFAYYMEQNGYSNLDYVFINLGINKVFGQNFATYPDNIPYELECYMDIIESIHNYDANIKIFCNLPTPPNTQNGKFSQAYGTSQMLWLYANNIKHYAKDMIDTISGRNVYIVGTNFVLNTDTDIFDGVHPTSEGYPILAKAMVNAVIGT